MFPGNVASAAPWQAMPHPPTAYNAVPMRTTLARPANVQPATPQKQEPKKPGTQFSQPVRDYVARCFAQPSDVYGITLEELQAKLKDVINGFAEKQMLDDVDWATYPLPQQIIAEERRRAIAPRPSRFGPSVGSVPAPASGNVAAGSPPNSKKRKVGSVTNPSDDDNIPPWRKTNGVPLKDRVTFAHQDKTAHQDKKLKDISRFNTAELEKRKQRFQPRTKVAPGSGDDADSDVPAQGPVVGTNMQIEKQFFRLTAPPKPEDVRPQSVLQKTLAHLKQHWKQQDNYRYICGQFKSLRQDLTVQHIKNSFAISVYETHARIALEVGDVGEYNQCQTQLRELYKLNTAGHPNEFLAYRILYTVYTCNKGNMNDLLAELTPTDKEDKAVKHALQVRSALALGNYHRFFQLYLDAPNMGSYLMDMFLERERLHALANISRAYLTVSLSFLSNELGFETQEGCIEFLTQRDIYVVDEKDSSQLNLREKICAAKIRNLKDLAFRGVDIKGQI